MGLQFSIEKLASGAVSLLIIDGSDGKTYRVPLVINVDGTADEVPGLDSGFTT